MCCLETSHTAVLQTVGMESQDAAVLAGHYHQHVRAKLWPKRVSGIGLFVVRYSKV
jgi:hypothetical protein